jgi:Icc protein
MEAVTNIMPVYLQPISRRRFLQRLGVAGAAVALGADAFAARRAKDENSWAILSDIHLAADRSKLGRGINMAEHFEIVSRELLALPKGPAGIFINGDCAFNSGETEDYATLGELLQPLREDNMPICLAMGNHDNREHFWTTFRDETKNTKQVPGRQTFLLRTRQVNWFVLDSLEKTLSTPGLLGDEQLRWLARTLDDNRKKPAIVFVHHNPGAREANDLKDTVAFLEVIRPRKQVKAYVFGHTHTWKVSQDESGIHFINLPPVAYVFHEGDPSGWVHATMAADAMRLELRCVDQTHKAHGQIFDLKWRV